MAQTVEDIAEMLNEIRLRNDLSTENLEKLLSEINLKLAVLTDDEATELIKIYVSELKSFVEEKVKFSSAKFENLEKLFDNVIISNSELAKKSELRELFESFSTNFQKFLSETAGRKVLLETINDKVDAINSQSFDKDSVISQIDNISDDIVSINSKIEKTFADMENIAENLKSSENFEDLKLRIKQMSEELSFQINSIPSNISLDTIEQKIDNCRNLTENLRDEFYQNASADIENSRKLADGLAEISNQLTSVKDNLNQSLYENHEGLKSILEKLSAQSDELSNSISEINTDNNDEFYKLKLENCENSLNVIKDLITEISVNDEIKILSENTDNRFESLSGHVNEIKSSFESNSKMNYENILKALNNLKIEISSDIAKNCDNADIEYMHNSLNELSGNVEILRNISTQKYQEITDNITATLKDFSNEISQKINSENNLNFEELKTVFNNLISEFDTVKSEFLKINDSTAFSISSGFSNVNTIFETVFAGINSLGENFDNVSKQNAQNILGRINDIILGFEELKLELNSSVYVDKIIGSINSVSTKIDELYEKDNYREDFDKIKDALAIIKSETDISREEYSRELKENVNIQTEQIRNVSENIDSLKTYINDIGENLKNYISETEAVRVSNNSQSEEKTTQKLLDLETALTQNVQNYEEQFKNLQSKLMEFVHIVEGSNSDTEGKIISSLEEVSGIKDELISLNDILKNISSTNSEKFNETISLLDAGVENIVFNINNINDSLKNGVENSVKENILSLEEKFVELTDILNILKKESSEFDEKLINDISEKITSMKDEISLVNTDITDAVQCKTNEILRSLEPLKLNLETIADIDLEKLLSEFKSEFEIYFRNFKDDLNKESEANSEAFSDIKQSYKEILNKISIVEEVVNKTLQNNIELLSISLESGLRGINSDFDEKLNNLKLYFDIALNNTRNQDAINELREQLFKAFESLKNEQSRCIISKANELSANVLNLSGTVKSGNKNIIKGLEIVDKRVGNKLANVNELVTALNTKVDVLASDKSDENLLDEIDEIKDIVKSLVEELKLDNSDIKEGLEIVDKKVGNKLANVNELITTLNAKVDVLASDDSDENLLDEIDEIKDIIFEQRKYFESASDEKSAAMDKYLKDVLLKLDNIDIQKNSEDIKETVLNAVLSLSDQISFVEETEDIKDFVEEKTDSIHQSLIQVHNQLKQLTSGDNDFEYTYTLQDVESDIAKLRLAMNNISVGKFEDISDEIKKIVLSVENLETNLTQDQIIDLRTDIEKINDDIISISSRTNKLLLNSDESYKAVNDGLNNFSNLILKLEDRINYLDNSELTKRIENKINNVEVISTVNANSNKVITQAMIYLGEWVDATTQDISSISDKISSIAENTSQISDIKDTVEKIKELIPDNTEIINELQEKFAHQEERIDNLERKLDQIISTLEEKNDMVLNRKADKIEKLLSEVGANIEKLTSYVDEE